MRPLSGQCAGAGFGAASHERATVGRPINRAVCTLRAPASTPVVDGAMPSTVGPLSPLRSPIE